MEIAEDIVDGTVHAVNQGYNNVQQAIAQHRVPELIGSVLGHGITIVGSGEIGGEVSATAINTGSKILSVAADGTATAIQATQDVATIEEAGTGAVEGERAVETWGTGPLRPPSRPVGPFEDVLLDESSGLQSRLPGEGPNPPEGISFTPGLPRRFLVHAAIRWN